ncbi:hypothetical protein [Cellulomonas sp. NPDC089187]|uniref:hypothetical protein n=1 Tax=Cellulomonas sp. NPDC089187 TaxID=3154970 RepID=UPI0034360553
MTLLCTFIGPAAQATPLTADPIAVLDPDSDTPEVPESWTTEDGSTPESVELDINDSQQTPSSMARVAGAGFNTGDNVVANSDHYTINLAGDSRIEQLRPAVNAAVADITRMTGGVVNLQVGGALQGSHTPADHEITVYLDDTPQSCGGSPWGKWIGCGGTRQGYYRSDRTIVVTSGVTYYPTRVLQYSSAAQTQFVTHELLHALGLRHYDGVFEGTTQLMHSNPTVNSTQTGDANGIRFLASNRGVIGRLDTAAGAAQAISVTGWAIDKNTSGPINVHVYVDGKFAKAVTANAQRADIAGQGFGTAHGFSTSVATTPGTHEVCVYGIAWIPSTNPSLGCKTVTVYSSRPPVGTIDSAASTVPGGLTVSGWTLDPDTTASIQAHLYVDGKFVTGMTAAATRNDVASAYGRGAAHGYTFNVGGVAGGTHEVCVYGIDTAGGPHPKIGCKSVTVVANALPIGRIDSATARGWGTINCTSDDQCGSATDPTYTTAISGWALDPNTSASIQVHLYVDGIYHSQVTASNTRNDVAAAYGLGAAHGYEFELSSTTPPDGPHEYCVWGIDSSGGPNPKLGCVTL